MKELKNDDLLHWIQSAPVKRNSNKKISKDQRSYPKPTKLTKDKIRKLAKSNIKLDSEIDLHGLDRFSARDSKATSFSTKTLLLELIDFLSSHDKVNKKIGKILIFFICLVNLLHQSLMYKFYHL